MDEFKPEDELKPDPAIVVLVVLVNLQNAIVNRRSTLMTLIWTPTIAVRRVRVKRVVKNLKLKKSTNPMKTIRWTKSVLNAVHVSVKAAHKPASRQYMMMGVGVLVLLLLIIGIGSALKAPQRLPASRRPLAKRVSIFPVTPPIRRMRPSLRRAPPPQNKPRAIRRRIFRCRRFLQRRRRDSRLWSLTVSSAWKCRAI